jgi:hypothetical protein
VNYTDVHGGRGFDSTEYELRHGLEEFQFSALEEYRKGIGPERAALETMISVAH